MAAKFLPPDHPIAKAARGWPSAPKEKPKGKTEIDWSHPITRDLRGVFLFQDDVYKNTVPNFGGIDKGTGAPLVKVGENIQLDDTVDYTLTLPEDLFKKDTSSTTFAVTSWTFVIELDLQKSSVANNDQYILTAETSVTNGSLCYLNNSGTSAQWRGFEWSDAVLSAKEPDITKGVFNTLSVVSNVEGSQSVFRIDGVQATGTRVNGAVLEGQKYHLFTDNAQTDRRILAAVKHIYIWPRALTSAELSLLERDPYCFLKPANQTPFLVGVSTAGGAYTLTVTQGTATVTGQSADMLRGVQLDVTEQALTVSGQLVTMTYSPVGSYDLIVTEGVATVSGQSVDMLRGLQLDVTEQALTVTGQSVDMTYAPTGSYNLAVTAGTATVTGQLVDLLYSRVLTVTEQAVTVTGQLVDMTYAQPGAYTLTVTQGTATVTGQSVTLTYSAALDLATVYARLTEVWQILGLDPNNPMTVTPTSRVSGDISQTISGDGITSTTVTRDP